jgi:hypothetical protein
MNQDTNMSETNSKKEVQDKWVKNTNNKYQVKI